MSGTETIAMSADIDARVLAAIRGGARTISAQLDALSDVATGDVIASRSRLDEQGAIVCRDGEWYITEDAPRPATPPDLAALHAAWMARPELERAAVFRMLDQHDDDARALGCSSTLDAAIALLRAGA